MAHNPCFYMLLLLCHESRWWSALVGMHACTPSHIDSNYLWLGICIYQCSSTCCYGTCTCWWYPMQHIIMMLYRYVQKTECRKMTQTDSASPRTDYWLIFYVQFYVKFRRILPKSWRATNIADFSQTAKDTLRYIKNSSRWWKLPSLSSVLLAWHLLLSLLNVSVAP